LVLVLVSSSVWAQDAKEFIRLAYEKINGLSSYSEITMQIVRPTWERSVSMKTWSYGTQYSLVYVTAPAKEKGQVSLKRDKEMWSWQPSINKMIKLPPSMMMQSWMGSDFTNDDLINQASIVNDYTHKILATEKLNGLDCYKIELIPKVDAPVVWGKIIAWVSIEAQHMFRTEYYDEDDYLIKTELAEDVKTMDGKEITTKFTTIPEDNPGNKTIMTIENIDFDIDVNEEFFSQQNMKRIR
jgi:outer membrane lipoprotein-sorting protein